MKQRTGPVENPWTLFTSRSVQNTEMLALLKTSKRHEDTQAIPAGLVPDPSMPTLTRQALYDLVWSMPVTKLAESLGLSDVGLAKICDRHEKGPEYMYHHMIQMS